MKNYLWSLKNDSEDNEKSIIPKKTESNHIYFYSDINHSSCLELNKMLEEKVDELLFISLRNDLKKDYGRPKLYLHISSFGGVIFSAISSMDTILRLRNKIDIITIVEGGVASAGTFISIVGTHRWITSNSFMLIHQLSSGLWGKYKDLKDGVQNCDRFMEMIKNIYAKYTNVPPEEIDQILDHDLWWDANKCLELKLVDKII